MKTILIVRPAQRAAADAETCRQAGWDALPFCPLEIVPDETALARLAERYAAADAVFWVSPTAVETARAAVDFSDGVKPQAAVGAATAKALQAAGVSKIHCPDDGHDSEAVLRLPFWHDLKLGSRVLLVRGHGGRDALSEGLAALGLKPEYAEIYFRRPHTLDWRVLNGRDVRAAYVTSAELVQALFAQAPQEYAQFLRNLLYFTHHPRIAEALRRAGAERVEIVRRLDGAALALADKTDAVPSEKAVPQPSADRPSENVSEYRAAESANTVTAAEGVIAVDSAGQAFVRDAPAGSGHTPLSSAEEPENQISESISAQPQPQVAPHTGKPMQEPNNQTPAAQPVVIKQSSGKGVALGALVLSLLALGAAGFLFVQGQNELKTRDLAVEQKLDKAALGESQNATLLQESLHRQQAITTELAKLASGQQQNSGQIASAYRAFQELQKGRVNWLVDETETMLNLASQQLLLSGNVQAAVGVLEHIESRLSRFDQPDLLPIKQAVSQDLTALKTRPYLDVSGTALRIDRLETAVAGLPLMIDGTLKPGEAAPAQQPAQSGSWWENAWNKTAETLKGLVEVRRLNSSDAMLMSPEQVYFVRENLRLRLLDARLALLQHNGEVYQSDLNNAEAAVKQYFDAQSPATQAWLKEIAALKTLDLRMISDDALKASLTAVNTYQEDRRTRVDASGFESVPAAAASSPSAPAAVSQPAAEQPSAAPKIPALPSENKAASGAKASEPAKETPKAAEKPAAAPAAKPASAAKPDAAKPAAKPENGAKGA